MRASTFFLVAAIALGVSVLCALGTWQVHRLGWKQELISQVETRIASQPEPLAEIEKRWAETGDVDYWPVTLSGRFDHAGEQYYYTTHKGQAGWNVYTPLQLEDARIALVNRGFVPDQLRDQAKRPGGLVEGEVAITGLARNPLTEKPNRFMPGNEPENRQFFWKSMDEMAAGAGVEQDNLLPFFVDAGKSDTPGGWPLGGTTLVSFPNNHLQYAITWYGLAAGLLVVGIFFLRSRAVRQ